MKQQPKQDSLPELGIVTAQDTVNYRVKVRLNLSGIETDFIRVGSPYVGPGWGFRALPKVGAEVLVVFPGGDLNEGIVNCQIYSDEADRPPVEKEEPCLIHESGSKMIFKANGDIVIEAKNILYLRGSQVQINDDR